MKSLNSRSTFNLTFAILCLSITGFACNSNHAKTGSEKEVQADQGPAWKLTYLANAATEAEKKDLVGAYGFTVTSDGNYIVGPGPEGQTLSGKLSDTEFSAILSNSTAITDGTALGATESCGLSQLSTTEDSLTFTRNHKTTAFLRKSTNGTLCANGLSTSTAENLRLAMIDAAQNHYALPFPSECLNAAAALEALYPSVQGCSTAADCSYLTKDYEVIEAGAAAIVFADQCTVAKSLPVANTHATQAKLAELQDKLLKTQEACGSDIVRTNCFSQSYFSTANSADPVCVQGSCRINPAVGL